MQRILLVGLEMWRQQRQRGGSSSMPTQANAPVSLHGRTERQRPYRGQPRHRDLKTLQLQVSVSVPSDVQLVLPIRLCPQGQGTHACGEAHESGDTQ